MQNESSHWVKIKRWRGGLKRLNNSICKIHKWLAVCITQEPIIVCVGGYVGGLRALQAWHWEGDEFIACVGG